MANTAVLTLETVEGAGLRFAVTSSGFGAVLDSGAGRVAPSPVESLLAALGGCEGMDVISILRKKRQRVTGYEIQVTGERRAEHPRSFTKIELVHRVRGHEVSAAALEEAIRLSATKYCSVNASLDPRIAVVSRFEVLPAEGGEPIVRGVVDTAHGTPGPPAPEPRDPGESVATASAAAGSRLGLSELILRVADVPRAVAFYHDVVGLAVERMDSPTWAWLWTGPEGRLPRLGLTSRPLSFGAAHTGGPAHFAIAVPRSAIPAEKARLEALGLEVEGPVTFAGWSADSIYFSDPDTNRVELCGFAHLDAPRSA